MAEPSESKQITVRACRRARRSIIAARCFVGTPDDTVDNLQKRSQQVFGAGNVESDSRVETVEPPAKRPYVTDDWKICDNDTQEGHVEVRSDSDDVHVNDEAAAPTSMDEIASRWIWLRYDGEDHYSSCSAQEIFAFQEQLKEVPNVNAKSCAVGGTCPRP